MSKHKHRWRKVGGTWTKDGCILQKKKCITCGVVKEGNSHMTMQVLKKKTVRLSEEIADVVESKEKPSVYMRNAIQKEVEREQKAKTRIVLKIRFAGCASKGYNDELEIKTFATGKLKEKIAPLMDAVEQLQEVILYLDP